MATKSLLVTILTNSMVIVLTQYPIFYNRLYDAVDNYTENFIISPLNAHIIISLAYQGTIGTTVNDFRENLDVIDKRVNALEYKLIMNELRTAQNVTVYLANKLYVKNRYRVRHSFKVIANYYFAAEIQNINFIKRKSAANEINAWVRGKTDNKIDRIVEAKDFDETVRAILLSALYFKAHWKHPFRKSDTREGEFYVNKTKAVPCHMMYQVNMFEYAENDELNAKILKMYYMNPRFSMVIILPNSKTGLRQLTKKVLYKNIAVLTDSSNMNTKLVTLQLPIFKVFDSFDLVDPLSQMGFQKMFSYFAKFGNLITSNDALTINKVIQKSFVGINEVGTEMTSASSTKVISRRKVRVSPGSIKFKADHPFMFYIIANYASLNTSNNVLCMGRISNPIY